jgi:hypothetical protein
VKFNRVFFNDFIAHNLSLQLCNILKGGAF